MNILNFKYNNKNYVCFTPELALSVGVPQSVIDSEIEKAKAAGQWTSEPSSQQSQ